jgi:hypothetical protein
MSIFPRLLLVTACWFPISASAQSIHLICLGAGEANRITSSQGYARDSNGNSAWGQVLSQRSVPFDDQVNIELADDDTGRVRMPPVMLPPLHGGDGGWFRIKNVKRTDGEITGTVQVNFMNQPKLRLDRVTGHISISGKAGDYSGDCQAYDPASVPRKF